MEWTNIEPKAQAVRTALLGIYEKIKANNSALLPARDDEFDASEQMLQQETFNVVVCGEVKKGKSSFINAIMGKALLPVDTQVATSQAFKIINSTEQAFSLVYTDGTKQPISEEELVNFGSQAKIDQQGEMVELGKVIDFIEVHTPIPFLPQNIVIIDTPGIGALYAAHARITDRFLATAAAVVFICDPQNPLTEPEVNFVDKVLNVTPQVLFVMTKMDNYEVSYITEMLRRNEEILSKFANRTYNKGIIIQPMSSKTLYKAAQKKGKLQNVYLKNSQFDTVKGDLLKMIYNTVGLSRNVYSFNVLNKYNSEVMNSIKERTQVLSTPENSKEILARKKQLRDDFMRDWGKNGEKQRKIEEKINDTIVAFNNQANDLFSTAGTIAQTINDEIDALTDYDEGKAFAQQITERMKNEFGQRWKQLLDSSRDRIGSILSEYQQGMEQTYALTVTDHSVDMTLPTYEPKGIGWLRNLNHFRSGFFTVSFASMLIGITNPVSWAVLGAAALIGWFESKSAKLEKLKVEAHKHVNNNVLKIRNAFCSEPYSAEEPISLLNKSQKELKTFAMDALQNIYDAQKKKVEDNIAMLTEQIAKDTESRKQAIKENDALKVAWRPIYNDLVATRTSMEELERLFTAG